MSRSTEQFNFIEVDENKISSMLISKYEELSGKTVHPASPERLFIAWATYFIAHILNQVNFIGNQNLPSRATGENLDALGKELFLLERPKATPSVTTLEFAISEAQSVVVIIPAGTRVSTIGGDPVFTTDHDAVIPIGDTTAQVTATCQTVGTSGNGYEAGQLTKLIDPFPYFESVTNTGVTAGGTDDATDDEYYDTMIANLESFSTAGAVEAYQYQAKSVGNVADVVVNSPEPGTVDIYTLMDDGTKASSTVKSMILAKCSEDNVRPLTDLVRTKDPDEVTYNITMTYYLSIDSTESATVLQARIEAAVDAYIEWQRSKMGLDINPDQLIRLVKEAGAKRVVITAPVFTHLRNGLVDDPEQAVATDYIPQMAKLGTKTLTNGGYDSE